MTGEYEASDVALQVCEAMSYLHQQGVAHRDLKPEVSFFCISRQVFGKSGADVLHSVRLSEHIDDKRSTTPVQNCRFWLGQASWCRRAFSHPLKWKGGKSH